MSSMIALLLLFSWHTFPFHIVRRLPSSLSIIMLKPLLTLFRMVEGTLLRFCRIKTLIVCTLTLTNIINVGVIVLIEPI